MHCKRSNGRTRAYFGARKDAEAFALTNPAYFGDIPALGDRCDHMKDNFQNLPDSTSRMLALLLED